MTQNSLQARDSEWSRGLQTASNCRKGRHQLWSRTAGRTTEGRLLRVIAYKSVYVVNIILLLLSMFSRWLLTGIVITPVVKLYL
jgi:hypothetical protein